MRDEPNSRVPRQRLPPLSTHGYGYSTSEGRNQSPRRDQFTLKINEDCRLRGLRHPHRVDLHAAPEPAITPSTYHHNSFSTKRRSGRGGKSPPGEPETGYPGSRRRRKPGMPRSRVLGSHTARSARAYGGLRCSPHSNMGSIRPPGSGYGPPTLGHGGGERYPDSYAEPIPPPSLCWSSYQH